VETAIFRGPDTPTGSSPARGNFQDCCARHS